MAFAGLIVSTGSRVAANLSWFAWDIVCISGSVIFALPEALAAVLVSNPCIVSAHMDIILAAGIILIIRAVNNRTI